MNTKPFPKIASLKTIAQFRSRLSALALELPVDDQLRTGPDAPLAQPLNVPSHRIGNRFAILPMEGWDGTLQGRPTELTRRRWRRFGTSGAKLIWGGEAVAVRQDGRGNPHQLLLTEANLTGIRQLRQDLVHAHRESFGQDDDLVVGLQLTHSGRFARPNPDRQLVPWPIYHHPWLDPLCQTDPSQLRLCSDDDLWRLIDDFVVAAGRAERAGFDFVDIKHCHGYLGHELLSAYERPGPFGGDLANRTRFLRHVVQGIQASHPRLQIGVRLSIFDFCPFVGDPATVGKPVVNSDYRFAFGGGKSGTEVDLSEAEELLCVMQGLGISLVCATAGSPYYNPHIQRPAQRPPSDGYLPPEDPLVGVTRQITAAAALKRRFPEMVWVGSGYSYLQEWLPHVAQAVVAQQAADLVGLGRMALSYPELPQDVLAGRPLQRKRICRTFSDCTTAPRQGMVSGCFPLDHHYQTRPERKILVQLKRAARTP